MQSTHNEVTQHNKKGRAVPKVLYTRNLIVEIFANATRKIRLQNNRLTSLKRLKYQISECNSSQLVGQNRATHLNDDSLTLLNQMITQTSLHLKVQMASLNNQWGDPHITFDFRQTEGGNTGLGKILEIWDMMHCTVHIYVLCLMCISFASHRHAKTF